MKYIQNRSKTHLWNYYREIAKIRADTHKLVTNAADGIGHDLAIVLPDKMTSSSYLKISRRLAALKRQITYVRLRPHLRGKQKPIIDMDEEEEKESVREEILKMYGIDKGPDDSCTFILRRSYYAFMCNHEFEVQSEKDKAITHKLNMLVESGWVIPDMEKDVLNISDKELDV